MMTNFLIEFQTSDLIILCYGGMVHDHSAIFQDILIDLHTYLPQVVCLHIHMHIQPIVLPR